MIMHIKLWVDVAAIVTTFVCAINAMSHGNASGSYGWAAAFLLAVALVCDDVARVVASGGAL